MEELNGVIENIVFRNDENGYTVAEAPGRGGRADDPGRRGQCGIPIW